MFSKVKEESEKMSQTLEKLEQDKKELESQVWRNRSTLTIS
jgi:predicted  nucleic acid-binding Zn-ribbon protein